jgi:hypothetical protein
MKNFTVSLFGALLSFAPFLLPMSAAAQGKPERVQFTETIETTLYNECSGEYLDAVMDVTTVVQTSFDAGFGLHGNFEVRLHGTAVGEATGSKYVVGSVSATVFHSNNGFELNMPDNFRLIGQGGVQDLKAHALVHATISANGELTANWTTFNLDCNAVS